MNDFSQRDASQRDQLPLSQFPSSRSVTTARTPWWADLILLSTALMWGTNILVFKNAISDVSPWVFNALRLVFATITLGILAAGEAWLVAPIEARKPVRWWRVSLFAFLSGFAYLVLFVIGIDLTTAGNTGLILASMPMWTAILSFVFLRERLPRVTWFGLLVTLVGTVIVTTQGSGPVSFSSRYIVGNVCMLLAAMTWATATVMSRPILKKITPLRLAFISALLTTPFHLLLVAAELPVALPQAMQPTILMAIIYSGVFSTGVAYVTWHVGVRAVGASHASVYQNIVTLVTVVGGWIVLKEQPLLAQVLGGILMIAGLFLMRRGRD